MIRACLSERRNILLRSHGLGQGSFSSSDCLFAALRKPPMDCVKCSMDCAKCSMDCIKSPMNCRWGR